MVASPFKISRDGRRISPWPQCRLKKRSLSFALLGMTLCLCSIFNITRLDTISSPEPCNELPPFQKSPWSFEKRPTLVHLTKNDVYTLKPLPIKGTKDIPPSKRRVRYWIDHGVSVHDPVEKRPDNCVAMAEWQDAHHPSCLLFHEIDLNAFENERHQKQLQIVGSGFYRSVWRIREYDGTPRALKTLRFPSFGKLELPRGYRVDFDPQTIEQQRIDAVVMEQLSASPYIANIYGYCSTSALVEYADGGNLLDSYKQRNLTKNERLHVAYNVAAAVAETHHTNDEGYATIAHTDLNPKQFLLLNGTYKLNDFNRAKLLSWNTKTNQPCPIDSGISWRAVRQTF